MKIRVLIAEDDQSIRKWYAYSLGSMEDIELLPMAENGYQAVASAVLYHPDVLILDMEMESRDAGLKAGQQVLSILPETKIIMLTVYDDDATIFRAYEMGAVDYLFKNASTEKSMRRFWTLTAELRPSVRKSPSGCGRSSGG